MDQSRLPEVNYLNSSLSMMYGDGLLLCRVLLGRCERYQPTGASPPCLADHFDSRLVVRDGQEIVVLVRSPAQVLPYTIMEVRRELFTKAGGLPIQTKSPTTIAPGTPPAVATT